MSHARIALEDLLRRLDETEEAQRPLLEPSPPVEHRPLCVAMATYDDFDGVWFTLHSVLLHHPEVRDLVNFVVVDNHPRGREASALKALDQQIPNLRYVPFDGYRGTAVRDLLFAEADADIVCCVDAHVLLMPGALAAVLDHLTADPESADLIQGPLLGAGGLGLGATHMTPEWSALMFGRWGRDEAAHHAGAPFEIEMHGLGLFACRPAAWPGLNPRLRGFGGEEGYLHEKIRRAGGRVLCDPRVAWSHRFQRIGRAPYRVDLRERLRNYRIGWTELGWDVAAVERHFRARCGDDAAVNEAIAAVERDLTSPFIDCDAVLVTAGPLDRTERLTTALEELGIGWRVERVEAAGSDDGATRQAGRRRAVELAGRRGFASILLVDGDVEIDRRVARDLASASTGVAPDGHDVVALAGGGDGPSIHLVRRRAFGSWPQDGCARAMVHRARPDRSTEVRTAPLVPAHQRATDDGPIRRAVVAVLLAREHLPFIRHWCEHHLADGWAVHLLDNTGSVGAVRRTSAERRDLVAARTTPPVHAAYSAHLSDGEVSAALADEVSDLSVTVTPWRPRAVDGAVVHGQAEAYARFVEAYRSAIEWAAFIDCDEYLVAGAGCDWDDLLDRAKSATCPRIVLEGVRYESRWSADGRPRAIESLRPCAIQEGGSKNLVRLADVTRTDLHWSWQMGANRIHATPDRMAYGFHHYRADPVPADLHLSERILATWIDESVAVGGHS